MFFCPGTERLKVIGYLSKVFADSFNLIANGGQNCTALLKTVIENPNSMQYVFESRHIAAPSPSRVQRSHVQSTQKCQKKNSVCVRIKKNYSKNPR